MTDGIQKHRNYSLDFIRVSSIIAVIVIHCIATVVINKPPTSSSWMLGNLVDSFARWSVPVFVMISGTLLIKRSAFVNTRVFLKKKLGHIAIPIIIWPLIYIAWNYFFFNITPNPITVLNEFISGSPAPGHLYFLFLIAGLYALTPIISLYASTVSKRQFIITTLIIISATAIWHLITSFVPGHEQKLNIITRSLPYVGFYMLGHILKDIDIKDITRKRAVIACSIFVLCGLTIAGVTQLLASQLTLDKALSFYEYTSILTIIFSVSAYLSGMAVYKWLLSRLIANQVGAFHSILAALSTATFGVYLIHMIVINVIVHFLSLNPTSVKHVLLLTILTIPVSYGLSITLNKLPYLRTLVK